MILNKEQLEWVERCRKSNTERANDLLDTIADLKRQLAERRGKFNEAIEGVLEILGYKPAPDELIGQATIYRALDAYVQERVDKVALASADTEVEFMNEDTLQVEKLRFRLPGETGMTANAGGWYSTAVYWKHKAIRAEEKVDRAVRPLDEALRGIIEIGKRDLSNPKWDGYFNFAREVLAANRAKVTGE